MTGAGAGLAVGFEGTVLPDEIHRMAEEVGLGGVVLFRRNCPDLDTVLALTAAAHGLGDDVLVLVDHEGGRVHRLPPPFTHFPPAAVVGRAGDPGLAGAVARAMARELRAAGFDSGLAPVLDCRTDAESAVIGDRAFGADPAQVAACGVAVVEASLAEGLLPVAKHFPGHGRTPLDSHQTLPEVGASRDTLERVELVPFVAALAAGCPAVLVAHVRYPALDPAWPASLSAEVIGTLLRGRLGFTGLALSDDLEMQAVAAPWGVGAAAVRFLAAGGDLALVCADPYARAAARAAVEAAIESGHLDLTGTRARREGIRQRLAAVRRPDVAIVGCAEHRALAEEVSRRAPG
jgi:beta-N-acetylhexosaminidase